MLAGSSGLSVAKMKETWAAANPSKKRNLDRDTFFTALAYVAIAQKGETPCIANLRMFPELPVPTLAGAKRLLDLGPDLPAVLVDFSHRELEEVDWISVTLEDRKGGVLVKHSKYTVVSRARGSTVHRRYSDFEALDNLLRRRFPYRIVLKLPPKGGPMGKLSTPTPEFLEDRRKGLARYLTHLVRHPTLRNDDLVVIFITEPNDVKPRLKTHEKLVKPEIATSKVAADPFAFVPPDFMEKIDGMRREIVPIIAAFRKICAVYDRNVKHRWDQEREWRSFSSELEGLASLEAGYLAGGGVWSTIQESFRTISAKMEVVCQCTNDQWVREDGSCDRIRAWCETLEAFKELMDRRFKTVEKDLGRIKNKLARSQAALEKADATLSGKLADRVEQRAGKEAQLEAESDFSVFCVHSEAKLIRIQYGLLGAMMEELIASQETEHLSRGWRELVPAATALVDKLDICTPFK